MPRILKELNPYRERRRAATIGPKGGVYALWVLLRVCHQPLCRSGLLAAMACRNDRAEGPRLSPMGAPTAVSPALVRAASYAPRVSGVPGRDGFSRSPITVITTPHPITDNPQCSAPGLPVTDWPPGSGLWQQGLPPCARRVRGSRVARAFRTGLTACLFASC